MVNRLTTAIGKGGVGKTIVSREIAGTFAAGGERTLIIDLDHQASLTESLGFRDLYERGHHLGQHLTKSPEAGGHSIEELIVSYNEHLDLIPAASGMHGLSERLGDQRAWHLRLRRVLEGIEEAYSWILLDTPPAINRVTDAALIYAGNAVVPVRPQTPSIRGLERLISEQVQPLREELSEAVEVAAIVPNYVTESSEKDRIMEALNESFTDKLAPEVRKRVDFSKSYREGQLLREFNPSSDMVGRIEEVTEFIRQRINEGETSSEEVQP
jgi:chromosome partitioning protein